MKTTAILSTSALFINPARSWYSWCYTRYDASLPSSDCLRFNTDPRCEPNNDLAEVLESTELFASDGTSHHLPQCESIRTMDRPVACYYNMEHYGYIGEVTYNGDQISCEDMCKHRTTVTYQGQTARYIDCGLFDWDYDRWSERPRVITRWHCVCVWNQENPFIYFRIARIPSPTSRTAPAPTSSPDIPFAHFRSRQRKLGRGGAGLFDLMKTRLISRSFKAGHQPRPKAPIIISPIDSKAPTLLHPLPPKNIGPQGSNQISTVYDHTYLYPIKERMEWKNSQRGEGVGRY